jgi:DNA-binding NtrC family response regulator
MCVIIMSAHIDLETAVDAMRAGAFDVIRKPFKVEQLSLAIRRGLEATRDAAELAALRRRGQGFARTPGMVMSEAPAMLEIYATVRKIAQDLHPDRGESGVGKDVLATLIHASPPRRKAFLEINRRAGEAVESGFVHEQGAFTDAGQQKQGLLELAHHGMVSLTNRRDALAPGQAPASRAPTFRRVGGETSRWTCASSATTATCGHGARRHVPEDLLPPAAVPLRVPALRSAPRHPAAGRALPAHGGLQFHKRLSPGADAVGACATLAGNIRNCAT